MKNLIVRAFVLIILMTALSCEEEAELKVVFEEDYFCEEGKEPVFFKLEIDGGDIFIDQNKAFDIDGCNISNQVVASFSTSSNDSGYATILSDLSVISENHELRLGLNTLFRKNELDLADDRAYAEGMLTRDFEYRVGSLTASERYEDEFGRFAAPDEMPSFVSFTLMVPDQGTLVEYSTLDPVSSSNFALCCEGFQEDSFFRITDLERIEFQNADFPEVTYNYILTGEFQCLIYRQQAQSRDKAVRVSKGSFRLPFNIPATSLLFEQ